MRAAIEPYRDALGEMATLYPLHWAEAWPDTDRPECRLAPRFDLYDALADRDEIAVVTLRDERRALVGYCLCFVGPDMHTEHCLRAATDLFFVHPMARGRHGGVRLIRAMRSELQRRGVHKWVASEMLGKGGGVGRLLELCGFRPEELALSVWLGG